LVKKRLGRRKQRSGAKKAETKPPDLVKTTVELRRDQDGALERIKLYYRDRSSPRIDKKALIQKAVDLLIAEFNTNKDFLLTGDK